MLHNQHTTPTVLSHCCCTAAPLGHNDFHTYGTHGSRYDEGEEYRQYLDTAWQEYNLTLFNTTLNASTQYIEVNGTYYPWLEGDDRKYRALPGPTHTPPTHTHAPNSAV